MVHRVDRASPKRSRRASRSLYRLLFNKYYVDEAYDAAVVNPLQKGSEKILWKGIDVGVIDWLVNASARAVGFLSRTVRVVQTGIAQALRAGIHSRCGGHPRLASCTLIFRTFDDHAEHTQYHPGVAPARCGGRVFFSPGTQRVRSRRRASHSPWWPSSSRSGCSSPSMPLWPDMQFVERIPWIPTLDVSYHVGIDGISLLLVVLTTFLTPIALLASWDSVKDRLKGFVALMLLLEVGTLGVFMSLDLFLFYVFWEFMLIPMYFIIGIWGGAERVYAAVKFFLYTMAGSLLMLVAIIWLGYYASTVPGGHFTTNLLTLYTIAPGDTRSGSSPGCSSRSR